MKRGWLVVIVLLLLPIVSATSILPYEYDDQGNKIDIQPLLSVKGGPPAFEHYFQGCPVVIQEEQGQPKFYYAKADEEGQLQPTEFTTKFKPAEFEQAGGACGTKFFQQRPIAPPPLPKWQQPPQDTLQKVQRAESYGMGVQLDSAGQYQYLDPTTQQAVDAGIVPPPKLPEPKPIINIITGAVTYEADFPDNQLKAIVIPVQFSDEKATVSLGDVKTKFFGTGGLGDYYDEQSYGQLQILGGVAPQWYTLSKTMGYYGDNYEENIEEMINAAIEAADEDVDFSQYDANGDGIVDSLFVVHAGDADEEDGSGNGEAVWSHYFTITPVEVDGVKIMDYETVSETSPTGIIAHEFGHYLGLPDMYDTVVDDGESKGVGEWSLMGYGGFLDKPGSLEPWSKMYLGWLAKGDTLEIEDTDFYKIYRDDAQQGTKYYRMTLSDVEQFIVENRHKTILMNGDDVSGLLIWHIDESVMDEVGTWNGCSGTRWDCNAVNGDADHKLVDVEEAGGTQDLDDNDMGDRNDVWILSCPIFGDCQQELFSKETNPSSEPYGTSTKDIVLGIFSEPGNSMEFSGSADGTVLEAPELAPKENSNVLIIVLASIVGVVILCSGGYLSYALLQKKKTRVSPTEYHNF